jgi:hypothetical protein
MPRICGARRGAGGGAGRVRLCARRGGRGAGGAARRRRPRRPHLWPLWQRLCDAAHAVHEALGLAGGARPHGDEAGGEEHRDAAHAVARAHGGEERAEHGERVRAARGVAAAHGAHDGAQERELGRAVRARARRDGRERAAERKEERRAARGVARAHGADAHGGGEELCRDAPAALLVAKSAREPHRAQPRLDRREHLVGAHHDGLHAPARRVVLDAHEPGLHEPVDGARPAAAGPAARPAAGPAAGPAARPAAAACRDGAQQVRGDAARL